jgi:hypothetical protein
MSPQMTIAQRAMQFWSVLVFAARMQKVLSYEMLFQMTGVVARGQSKELGIIWSYCQQKGLPLLTSIVLEQSTGRPADPLLNAALSDLEAEHRRVFIFDWFKNGSPTLDEFQAAAAKEEETVNA